MGYVVSVLICNITRAPRAIAYDEGGVVPMTKKQRETTKTMHAMAIDRFGGPEVLSMHTLPVPVPNANEVLIAVHTAEVGGWDADMRDGWSPDGKKPRFPLVLGGGGSGTVAAVGSRVRRFRTGEPVYSFAWNNPKGGFYAEYVAVPAGTAAPVPNPLDLRHAGAVPITGLTAIRGIDDTLHVKKDERVIIHGASGGVGVFALQFAKLRGARVLATASGADGVALALELGADAAVDGRHGDIARAAQEFAPDGVDAILALAGGETLERCVDALRKGGRLAYPNGIEPEPKRRRGIKTKSYDATVGREELEHLGRAVEAARLQVPIAAEFALADAARAHERLAQGHVLGKIVLRVR
jgi:NADPH:quinone reductase-like Zn-dependent oxidoreductase